MTTSHRMSRTPTYNSWRSMLERCGNTRNIRAASYSARGISVCDEWRKFDNFYRDMGERPANHTLDRIDNDKGYCAENCRWATSSEQSRNTSKNVIITWKGESKILKDWANSMGITHCALRFRIDRWGLERAMESSKLRGLVVLTDEQVMTARETKASGGYFWGATKLAELFGVTHGAIAAAATGKTHKHLPMPGSRVVEIDLEVV